MMTRILILLAVVAVLGVDFAVPQFRFGLFLFRVVRVYARAWIREAREFDTSDP